MSSETFEYDGRMTVSCRECGGSIRRGDECATVAFGLYYLCAACAQEVPDDAE